jgi:hypothetical protein
MPSIAPSFLYHNIIMSGRDNHTSIIITKTCSHIIYIEHLYDRLIAPARLAYSAVPSKAQCPAEPHLLLRVSPLATDISLERAVG